MPDKQELLAIQCAREGDQQAWAILFEMHFDAVHSFSTQLAKGHVNMAEDVTQETFMIAARRITHFQADQGSFRSWLVGIARNRHLKLVSSGTRRRQREDRYAQDKPDTCLSAETDMLFVTEVLARMTVEDRSLLEAKYLDAKTVKEIAQAYQISEHAAESRLWRARERFSSTCEAQRDHLDSA